MERPPPPDRVPVTAKWLAEQQAKQEAYAARRRAWVSRAAGPEDLQEPPAATAAAPAPVLDMTESRSRQQRGPVHDARQTKLEF